MHKDPTSWPLKLNENSYLREKFYKRDMPFFKIKILLSNHLNETTSHRADISHQNIFIEFYKTEKHVKVNGLCVRK